MELLLLAARVGPADERERSIEERIARGVDWPRAVALARAHRLSPVLLDAVRERPPGADGEVARRRLEEESKRSLYAGVFLAAALPGIVTRLAGEGIEAVAFKGPTLAMAAYGSLALRPFDDLDLVVRPRDFARARAALLAAGFRPSEDAWSAVRHLSHEQAFEATEGRLQLDLHGRLFSREIFPVDLDRLWTRRTTIPVGGHAVATFRAEDLLPILCEHAHKHLWQRLLWVSDVARLVAAHPGFDWDAALRLAREGGGRRVLAVGVDLAARLLAAPVPPEILRAMRRDPVVGQLGCAILGRLESGPPAEGVEFDAALSVLQWRSRERWRDRLRLLVTPNESDWMLRPLPAALAPLYYLMRPLRLLAKYGRRRRPGGAG